MITDNPSDRNGLLVRTNAVLIDEHDSCASECKNVLERKVSFERLLHNPFLKMWQVVLFNMV